MIWSIALFFITQYGLAAHNSRFAALLGAERNDLYHVEIATTAAVLGFLIAATAILGTADSIQALKREHKPAHRTLVATFTTSMLVSIVAIVVFLIAIIIDPTPAIPQPPQPLYFSDICLAMFALVLARVARSVNRLFQSLVI